MTDKQGINYSRNVNDMSKNFSLFSIIDETEEKYEYSISSIL